MDSSFWSLVTRSSFLETIQSIHIVLLTWEVSFCVCGTSNLKHVCYPWRAHQNCATPSHPSSAHHFFSQGVQVLRVASTWLICSEQRKLYFLEITLHTGSLTVNSEADTTKRTQIWSNLRDLCSQPREKLISYYIHSSGMYPLICGDEASQPRNDLKPRALKHSTNTFKMLYSDIDTVGQQLISYLEFPGDKDSGLRRSAKRKNAMPMGASKKTILRV